MNTYTFYTENFANPSSGMAFTKTFNHPNNILIKAGKHGYPSRATVGSAGFDLKADLIDSITIEPNTTKRIATGCSLELPIDVAALVLPRSGLAYKHMITVANTPGLIDPDYRGEIMVLLRNEGTESFTINDGDRIAQILFVPFIAPSFSSVEELSYTHRGANGFGSTDRS
jgi:dUTP pyrophosphatase